jgi:hypothetical protein
MKALGLLCCLFAADPTDEKAALQEWIAFYGAAAAEYQIEVQDAAGEYVPIPLEPTPILQYTNPVRVNQTHGACYVWTQRGRPLCVAAIWSVIPPDDPLHRWISHELHSLATGPLRSQHAPREGRRGPVPQWATQQPGIVWQPATETEPPAATAALRLVQMRRLAEQFTARLSSVDQRDEGELRLLPRPLYRYPADVEGALDGGLFAFVLGTDPEVLLLIEAHATADETAPRWHYALAHLTNAPVEARRNDRLVWSHEAAEPYVGHHPHFLYFRIHPVGLDRP